MHLKKHALELLAIVASISLIGYSIEWLRQVSTAVGDYFQISTELLPLILSFTIFVITWYAYSKSGDNYSLFAGAAFLLIGVLNMYNMLSHPFMPAFITSNSLQKAAFFWGLSLFVTSLLFLAGSYVNNNTLPRLLTKPALFVSVNAAAFILLTCGLLYHMNMPVLVYSDGSHSINFNYLIIISSIIILYSAYLYSRRLSEIQQNNIICIIYSLIILFFSNLSYLYSDYAGNLLRAASFYFVYLGVYKSSVELPYEKITETEKNLRYIAEERYRNLVDNANDAIITTDLDGRIVTWNRSAGNIFGWNAEEAVGKKLSMLIIPTDMQAENELFIHKILMGGSVSGIESMHKQKDGTKINVSVTVSPLHNTEGRITGLSCIIRDITDRKHAEEIEKENIRLAMKIRTKSELLPAISHDLGTPLNAIIGFSELLKQGMPGKLNEKQEKYIDNILVSSRRLLDIINDILDLGRAETGKIDLAIEKIQVSEIIDNTAGLVRQNITKRNVELRQELDPELGFIDADRQRFRQILFNLLSNAVKNSKPEGGTVTIKTEKKGDMAKFSVSDTGIGIKEENMGKLFSAFEQLDLSIASKYGSTGLGLVVTKKLVEMHGGRIRVESRYGEGSTFTFYIPIEEKK